MDSNSYDSALRIIDSSRFKHVEFRCSANLRSIDLKEEWHGFLPQILSALFMFIGEQDEAFNAEYNVLYDEGYMVPFNERFLQISFQFSFQQRPFPRPYCVIKGLNIL